MLTKIPNCVQYYVVLTFQVKSNFVPSVECVRCAGSTVCPRFPT